MKRDFINLSDFTKEQLLSFIQKAIELKKEKMSPKQILQGQTMALLFDKKSTRTRMSFEVGMKQLGGHTLLMESVNSHSEPVIDMAEVYSRYVDCIVARLSDHQFLKDLAKHSYIPVINAMTDESHPCQILAHLMTLIEKGKDIENITILWCGDYNNVSHTFYEASKIFGYRFCYCGPVDVSNISDLISHNSIMDASKDVDVIVTDTWVSMGQEKTKDQLEAFYRYQVTRQVVENAKKDVLFSHCMPIYRDKEVTSEVLEMPNAICYDEAENRLHIQKAILAWALETSGVEIQ